MAAIKHITSGRVEYLTANHRVGRASTCHTQLHSRRVSGDHAVLRWRDERWEVRDLGSTNGTFVDGVRLDAGASAPLARHARIGLGSDSPALELIDDTPPVILARLADGGVRYGDEDGLFLPDERDARWVVYQDGPGCFYLRALDPGADGAPDIVKVEDGQELRLGDTHARVSLPVVPEATWSVDDGPRRLATVGLRFAVSRDEEHVQIAVVPAAGPAVALRPRAHGYLLLTLARARLDDAANGAIPAAEHGWLHKGELARRLGCTGSQLNVDIHRAKEQLRREARVADSDGLFELRPGPRLIRLAVARLTV